MTLMPLIAEGGLTSMLVWLVIMCGAFYFALFRPQNKQRKEHEALVSSIAIGDVILTSSGFYGVLIDITEDTVIVEFGNNKNCRIPMQKEAIVRVEKAE